MSKKADGEVDQGQMNRLEDLGLVIEKTYNAIVTKEMTMVDTIVTKKATMIEVIQIGPTVLPEMGALKTDIFLFQHSQGLWWHISNLRACKPVILPISLQRMKSIKRITIKTTLKLFWESMSTISGFWRSMILSLYMNSKRKAESVLNSLIKKMTGLTWTSGRSVCVAFQCGLVEDSFSKLRSVR